MEKRSTPEPPRRPTSGRKSGNASPTPPAPPWLWFLQILAVAFLIYYSAPKSEVDVTYSFFLNQVDKDNVESVVLTGLEVRGVLREKTEYTPAKSPSPRTVKYFATSFPSEHLIQAVVDKLYSRGTTSIES